MAKLTNIILQLSEKDYQAIYDSLIVSNADKSAFLLKALRERTHADGTVMEELDVNTNAYYTLRSRLNQKIEEYLLQQMESPRTDLLKKVANINEVLFTKKKTISIATIKKLEKELLDYDLSNELTLVYKALKKLHIHTPEHYEYSQLYNKHVAYMLAIDRAEDILSDYFKKFGVYSMTGDEVERLGLTLLKNEIENVARLYESHRLFVYQSCINIFHRLFVEGDEGITDDEEPIEDILIKVNKIFATYEKDTIYYHFRLLFEFLRLEYYNYYKVYRKAEKYYEDVNEAISSLLTNYSWYTYPSQFLHTKIERCIRAGEQSYMYIENEMLFADYEVDEDDMPKHIEYITYRAISCHYADKYEEASRWLNNLLNNVNLKKYPYAQLEIKSILALEYAIMKEYDLFNQLISSIQRQIRLMGKEHCEHVINFVKILKTAVNDTKRNKQHKIRSIFNKMKDQDRKHFSPTKYILFDEKLMAMIC
ncbi:hypothetical protein [Bernardetia sp.]|uniref:hypothetical protein n=1 Tax=Bernardetia sp. TaxID=1937974 RepID=UPI0025C6ACCA|nr:hypothetical protein [Bernardetia sp.]